MAQLTNQEKLDAFCEAMSYDTLKLQDETKSNFRTRLRKQWERNIIRSHVLAKRQANLEAEVNADVGEVD